MQIDPTPRQRVRRSERFRHEWSQEDDQALDRADGVEALVPDAAPVPTPTPDAQAAQPAVVRSEAPTAARESAPAAPAARTPDHPAPQPVLTVQSSRYAAPSLTPTRTPVSRAGYAAPRPVPERRPEERQAAPDVPRRSPGPAAPVRSAAPSGAMVPPRPARRASEAVHAEVAARPEPAARPQEQSQEERFPRWLAACIGLLTALCLVLLTSQVWMSVYLQNQAQARADAHQALLDAHPLSYQTFIHRYAAEYNLQPAFVASIILNESSYRANAESNVGARGLMQLMPATAEWIAGKLRVPDYSFEQLWDAETNIRFGCWYLNYLAERFGGDPVAVTAAYHAGQGQVASWLNDRRMSPDGQTLKVENMIDGPTKVYAGRVTKHYAIYDALYFHTFNHLPDDPAAAH